MIVVDLGPSILNWLASREPGAKAAAMLIGLGERDIAAMAAHDPLTNGQPKSGTIGTIRQKGFKNSGLDGLRDAGPLSSTVKATVSFSAWVLTQMCPPFGIAWTALRMRLRATCWICPL